jgi:methylmalonyl-CoA mutase
MSQIRPDLPPLASEFPAATREHWLALTQKALKGAAPAKPVDLAKEFDRRLVARTADGLQLQPVYPRAVSPTAGLARAASGQPWGIAQRVDHPDPAIASALALADLDGGAGQLTLVTADSSTARGFGLATGTALQETAFDETLKGVMLDLIHLRLEAGASGMVAARAIAALAARRGHAPSSLSVNFGLSPLSRPETAASWATGAPPLVKLVTSLRSAGFAGPFIAVDLRPCREGAEIGGCRC